jgi:hypothetical protein
LMFASEIGSAQCVDRDLVRTGARHPKTNDISQISVFQKLVYIL